MKKSTLIKTLSFVLVFTLVFCVVTIPTPTIAEQLFEDVPETHWAYFEIIEASNDWLW